MATCRDYLVRAAGCRKQLESADFVVPYELHSAPVSNSHGPWTTGDAVPLHDEHPRMFSFRHDRRCVMVRA